MSYLYLACDLWQRRRNVVLKIKNSGLDAIVASNEYLTELEKDLEGRGDISQAKKMEIAEFWSGAYLKTAVSLNDFKTNFALDEEGSRYIYYDRKTGRSISFPEVLINTNVPNTQMQIYQYPKEIQSMFDEAGIKTAREALYVLEESKKAGIAEQAVAPATPAGASQTAAPENIVQQPAAITILANSAVKTLRDLAVEEPGSARIQLSTFPLTAPFYWAYKAGNYLVTRFIIDPIRRDAAKKEVIQLRTKLDSGGPDEIKEVKDIIAQKISDDIDGKAGTKLDKFIEKRYYPQDDGRLRVDRYAVPIGDFSAVGLGNLYLDYKDYPELWNKALKNYFIKEHNYHHWDGFEQFYDALNKASDEAGLTFEDKARFFKEAISGLNSGFESRFQDKKIPRIAMNADFLKYYATLSKNPRFYGSSINAYIWIFAGRSYGDYFLSQKVMDNMVKMDSIIGIYNFAINLVKFLDANTYYDVKKYNLESEINAEFYVSLLQSPDIWYENKEKALRSNYLDVMISLSEALFADSSLSSLARYRAIGNLVNGMISIEQDKNIKQLFDKLQSKGLGEGLFYRVTRVRSDIAQELSAQPAELFEELSKVKSRSGLSILGMLLDFSASQNHLDQIKLLFSGTTGLSVKVKAGILTSIFRDNMEINDYISNYADNVRELSAKVNDDVTSLIIQYPSIVNLNANFIKSAVEKTDNPLVKRLIDNPKTPAKTLATILVFWGQSSFQALGYPESEYNVLTDEKVYSIIEGMISKGYPESVINSYADFVKDSRYEKLRNIAKDESLIEQIINLGNNKEDSAAKAQIFFERLFNNYNLFSGNPSNKQADIDKLKGLLEKYSKIISSANVESASSTFDFIFTNRVEDLDAIYRMSSQMPVEMKNAFFKQDLEAYKTYLMDEAFMKSLVETKKNSLAAEIIKNTELLRKEKSVKLSDSEFEYLMSIRTEEQKKRVADGEASNFDDRAYLLPEETALVESTRAKESKKKIIDMLNDPELDNKISGLSDIDAARIIIIKASNQYLSSFEEVINYMRAKGDTGALNAYIKLYTDSSSYYYITDKLSDANFMKQLVDAKLAEPFLDYLFYNARYITQDLNPNEKPKRIIEGLKKIFQNDWLIQIFKSDSMLTMRVFFELSMDDNFINLVSDKDFFDAAIKNPNNAAALFKKFSYISAMKNIEEAKPLIIKLLGTNEGIISSAIQIPNLRLDILDISLSMGSDINAKIYLYGYELRQRGHLPTQMFEDPVIIAKLNSLDDKSKKVVLTLMQSKDYDSRLFYAELGLEKPSRPILDEIRSVSTVPDDVFNDYLMLLTENIGSSDNEELFLRKEFVSFLNNPAAVDLLKNRNLKEMIKQGYGFNINIAKYLLSNPYQLALLDSDPVFKENINYILDDIGDGSQKHLTNDVDWANEDDKLEITSYLFSRPELIVSNRELFDTYFNEKSGKKPIGVTHDRRIDYKLFKVLGLGLINPYSGKIDVQNADLLFKLFTAKSSMHRSRTMKNKFIRAAASSYSNHILEEDFTNIATVLSKETNLANIGLKQLDKKNEKGVPLSFDIADRLVYYVDSFRELSLLNNNVDKSIQDKIDTVFAGLRKDAPEINDKLIGEIKVETVKMRIQLLYKLFGVKEDELTARRNINTIAKYSLGLPKDENGYDVIDITNQYVQGKSHDSEIKNVIHDALVAEAEGRFNDYKYGSNDYTQLIDEYIKAELTQEGVSLEDLMKESKLPLYEQLRTEAENTKSADLEAIVKGVEGIEKWKDNKAFTFKSGESTFTVEFTDDYATLINVGNPTHFGSCQATCKPAYNNGLSGYVANGATKALVVRDADGRLISRQMAKLRLAKIGDKTIPVVFFEPRYGVNTGDQMESVGALVAKDIGAAVAGSNSLAKEKSAVTIELFPGNSPWDYSDNYGKLFTDQPVGLIYQKEGNLLEAKITTGYVDSSTLKEEDLMEGLSELKSEQVDRIFTPAEQETLRLLEFNQIEQQDMQSAAAST